MGGQVLTFSESDLIATCAAYDPAKHEAPLVVGHPQHDMPAYGWVQSLAFSDGGIDATPAQVNADFADMVAAGAFKKISASFYAPEAPQNPVPGVYYLRHVGFLGATAPAVKGMRAPTFNCSDTEAGVVTFSEWDDVDNASLWRSLRDWFIGKFGMAEADTVIPGYKVQSLEQAAQDEVREAALEADTTVPPTPAPPQFADPVLPTPKESLVTPEEKAALEAENARMKAELARIKTAQVHASNVAFCETLVGLPTDTRKLMVHAFNHFDALDAPLEFGEGDARAPLVQQLKAALAALPPLVEFGERATQAQAAAGADAVVAFTAPAGFEVSAEGLVELGCAQAYQRTHKCDLVSAIAAVQAGQS